MPASYSPFDILGLASTAEPSVITAAYRALVRKYHPDVNQELDLTFANQAMAKLNWAMEELAHNLDGWRLKAPRRRPWPSVLHDRGGCDRTWPPANALAIRQLEVTPNALRLSDSGLSAVLLARAPYVNPETIRVRFSDDLTVQRLSPSGNAARFRVALKPLHAELSDGELPMPRLAVVASGLPTIRVYVSIERRTQSWVSSRPSSEISWFLQRLQSTDRVAVSMRS